MYFSAFEKTIELYQNAFGIIYLVKEKE